MKKRVGFILTVALLILTTGCGNKTATNSNSTTNNNVDNSASDQQGTTDHNTDYGNSELDSIEIKGKNLDLAIKSGSKINLDIKKPNQKFTQSLKNKKFTFDATSTQSEVKAILTIPHDSKLTSLTTDQANGELDLENISVDKLNINAQNADVDLKHSTVNQASSIKVSNGEIDLEQVNYQGIKIEIGNGELEVNDHEIHEKTYHKGDQTKAIKINVSNGSVNVD